MAAEHIRHWRVGDVEIARIVEVNAWEDDIAMLLPNAKPELVQRAKVSRAALKGRMQLTIGDETRVCEAGSLFMIPPNVKHRAVAVEGPAVVLDVFSPVREECRM